MMLKKKMVSVLLAVAMVLGLGAPAFAAEEEQDKEGFVLVESESFDLTSAEAVELLMEKKGYTRKDAEEKVYGTQNMMPYSTTAGTVSHNYQRKTYTHGGYSIEIGGLYEYWTNGQYRQINALIDMWTAAIGSGDYTWTEFSLADTTASYPTGISTLMATGCIEVAVSTNVSSSVSAKLLDSGFTLGTSIGSTEYYRKVIDMTLTYKVY